MSCNFYFVYCLLDLVVVSVMLYPCILCLALLMDLFVLWVACFTVFVNCLVKQFSICLGVVVILLLNVMEDLTVGRGALFGRTSMVFQKMCVLCLWSQCESKCSFYRFCLCLSMSEVISSLVAVHLTLWYIVVICHLDNICEHYIGSVYVGGYCGLRKCGLCVFSNFCPFGFLVVFKSASVLL